MRILSLCLLLSLITVGRAQGYTPDNHEKLTRNAVLQFNHCVKELAQPERALHRVSKKMKDILISSNRGEDVKNLKRARFWHFYDPQKRLKAKGIFFWAIGVQMSLHKYFRSVERGFRHQITLLPKIRQSSLYNSTGRMIHFLQDVTVPAHVVPNYHGGPPGPLKDNFDKHAVPRVKKFYSKRKCQNLFSKKYRSLKSLLNELAKRTKKSINQKIMPNSSNYSHIRWTCFWRGKRGASGFREYGSAGTNAFGKKNRINCGRTKNIPISKRLYAKFSRVRHRDAVDATIHAIVYMQRLMAEAKERQ